MKISVLTDERGEIIGTARPGLCQSGVEVEIAPDPGQEVHDLVVPDEFGELKATELHARLLAYLKKPSSEGQKADRKKSTKG